MSMVMPHMRTCANCGERYPSGDAIDETYGCPHCGEPLLPFLGAQRSETDELPSPFNEFGFPEDAGYGADRTRELHEMSRPSESSA
jgi:predicted  nucleic acid-binding Zn-ribbon protein